MSNTEEEVTVCDWCLQEARVQNIDDKLWRFWKIISTEDPNMTSHKNICDKCKSRYQGFSIYIERCKNNTSKIDELLSMGQVKDEPSVDIKYPPIIKTEMLNEVGSNFYSPAVSSGVSVDRQMLAGCSYSTKSNDSTIGNILSAGNIEKESLIDIEDYLMNEEDVRNEEGSDLDYPTTSGVKGVAGLVLEHQVLSDSMVQQKKVDNNRMCTYCGKIFPYPYRLKMHLRTHTGEKPFKCSHCNDRFAYLPSLNLHLCTHTGEKLFKCSYCSKGFAQLSYLNVHLRTHTCEKPFKCSHCNKMFTRSDRLNDHVRIHTGEKPFKCSHCNKSFTQSSTLNVHLRTHTGEKPFKCLHCNTSFSHSHTLNVHLRTHTGEKPYKCSHCNKCFAHSVTLRYHLRIHTGGK